MATWLLVAGALTFFVGAGIAVPRVFTEPDPEQRLRMLEDRPTAWRLGQPLYGVGALLAALGVGALALYILLTVVGLGLV